MSSAASRENACESARSLIMKLKRLLNGASIRSELELVARRRIECTLQKFERVFKSRGAVKRREAASKHFSYGSRLSQRPNQVLSAVLQDENSLEPRLIGRGKRSFPVPRCAVHPQPVMVKPQNDAVITQNFRVAD